MGSVALVTGATSDIGSATAYAFAEAGYSVVLAARREARLLDLAAKIRTNGGRALPVVTDVTDAVAVERLVDHAVREFGGLHAAFNNAGSGPLPAPLAQIEPDAFDHAVRINLHGTYHCMRSEIRAMNDGGAIVNMSSTAGMQGVAGLGPYCAGKHAIVGLSKAAALDYAGAGIRINVVAPGPIATERIPEDQRERVAEFVPLQRIGRPEDVARLVVWLCSNESAFITGVVLPIDGGRLAGTPSFAR
jgi:NAD(P)-dependent dehydrogenase (short-subunit alcohol dehydrogenase family)